MIVRIRAQFHVSIKSKTPDCKFIDLDSNNTPCCTRSSKWAPIMITNPLVLTYISQIPQTILLCFLLVSLVGTYLKNAIVVNIL